MIPFIDNIGYNGPLPNFSRDNMTWEKMQTVSEQILDPGHMVYCTTDELGWLADATLIRENADQEVDTLEDLQELEGLELGTTVWVISENSGFVWNIYNERRGHYVYLGNISNIPQWAKIINEDGSIAGSLNVSPISNEFIDALSEEPSFIPSPVNMYLNLYSSPSGDSLNGEGTQFETTVENNIIKIPQININYEGSGFNFGIREGDWVSILGWYNEENVVTSVGTDYLLAQTNQCNGWATIQSGSYSVTVDLNTKTIRFDTIQSELEP